MNRVKFMLAAVTIISVVAACAKKDFNSITGTTDFTGVAITPASAALHVRLVPDSIFFDSATAHLDTIPRHIAPVDSVLFAVSTVPGGAIIANALTNSVAEFSKTGIVELSPDNYFVPDTVGTSTFTITYTDVDHNFAPTTAVIPITVTLAP